MLSLATPSPGAVATDDRVTRFLNTITPNVVGTIADFAAFNWVFFESQTVRPSRSTDSNQEPKGAMQFLRGCQPPGVVPG